MASQSTSFEPGDWPFPVTMICHKHTISSAKLTHSSYPEIVKGDSVVAKHKNGRYYHTEVVEIEEQVFYSVDFDDGSFSNDLFPQDIQGRNCSRNGPPKLGSRVSVKWTDDDIYKATFRGETTQYFYMVEFEDGSELKLPRDKVWAESEELPKYVRSRLSSATEKKHDLYAWETVRGKRQRQANLKYLKDVYV